MLMCEWDTLMSDDPPRGGTLDNLRTPLGPLLSRYQYLWFRHPPFLWPPKVIDGPFRTCPVAKFIVPELGDIVDLGIGLPESTLSPSQGL
jgi:hypothetical protein